MKNKKKFFGVFVLIMAVILIAPNKILAGDFSDIIEAGKISVKSVEPKGENDIFLISELISREYEGYGIDTSTCNETYTKCKFIKWEDFSLTEEIEIEYVYDETIKQVVDKIVSKIPEGEPYFYLTDIEFINYVLNTADLEIETESDLINIATYSSELKKLIGYKNFVIEPRMGGAGMFYHEQAGSASFEYDGTIYAWVDFLGVRGQAVIYVDDDTTDIESAIKARLSKYFDVKDVTDAEYTVEQYLEDERNSYSSWYDQYEESLSYLYGSKENYIEEVMNREYYNEDAPCYFLNQAENNIYVVQFGNGLMMDVTVIKDSSKISDIKLITNDVNSDITVSTSSTSVPLDTLIQVARLTSGEEYDKIVKLLEVENSESYDINLYSKTSGNNITKLEDGNFEVKIPINESLKDKNLVVYYVDEKDKIVEYEVTVKDGYATFETDHFSIYTLAEKTIEEQEKPKNETYTADLDNIKLQFTDEEGHEFQVTVVDILSLSKEEINKMVTEKEYNETIEKLNKNLKDEGKIIGIYVIEVEDENGNAKTEGKFQIKIKFTEELKKYTSFKLVNIDEENDYAKGDVVKLTIDGDYLVGELPHLSVYVLVGEETEIKEEKITNPTTGDQIIKYVGLLGISVLGIATLKVYTKKNKEITQ